MRKDVQQKSLSISLNSNVKGSRWHNFRLTYFHKTRLIVSSEFCENKFIRKLCIRISMFYLNSITNKPRSINKHCVLRMICEPAFANRCHQLGFYFYYNFYIVTHKCTNFDYFAIIIHKLSILPDSATIFDVKITIIIMIITTQVKDQTTVDLNHKLMMSI